MGNMEPYFFQGIVLPERAQLSFEYGINFTHLTSGFDGIAKVNIILNQVAVWVESNYEWDIHDLRNIVKNIVQNHLNLVGYLKGFAYDLQLTRVINKSRNIDYVFGIDIPCLKNRNKSIDLHEEIIKLQNKSAGVNGMFITRCFRDLASAMKDADDTGFYCYRAIESLRHHCAAIYELSSSDKIIQWNKFREIAACDEDTLRSIKQAADPLRHGDVTGISSDDRASLFIKTWDIVDGYIKNII